MDKQQIIKDWLDAIEETEAALQDWKANLKHWQEHGADYDHDFLPAFQSLCDVGLEAWLDGGNGLDVDRLAEAVTGGEL